MLHSPLAVIGTVIALIFLALEIARYGLAIAVAPTAPSAGGIVLAGLAVIGAQVLPRLATTLYQRILSANQPDPPSEG